MAVEASMETDDIFILPSSCKAMVKKCKGGRIKGM